MRHSIAILISVLVCLMAAGQAFTPRRPFIPAVTQSGNIDPNLLVALRYLWRTNGLSIPLTNWVDEIQGAIWTTNGVPSTPINSNGVLYFTSDNRLTTNTTMHLGTGNSQWMVVLKFDSIATQQTLWGNVLERGSGINSPSGVWRASCGFGPSSPFVGQWVDIVYIGYTGSNYDYYTNGVLMYHGPLPDCAVDVPTELGRWPGDGEFFQGYMAELRFWTNNPNFTNGLASQSISNLHWYATNTYKYSP